MAEVLDRKVKRVAQAICQREFGSLGQCKACRAAYFEYDPVTKEEVYVDAGDGCLGYGYAYLAEIAIAAMNN